MLDRHADTLKPSPDEIRRFHLRARIHDLILSLTDSAFEFAQTNPRLIAKASCKAMVAISGAIAVTLATHGYPVVGGLVGSISAGALALDGYMSDSQGKDKA